MIPLHFGLPMRVLVFILLMVLCSACKEKVTVSPGFVKPEFDFAKELGAVTIDIDFGDNNCQVVPLATSKDSYISETDKNFLMSKDYILVETQSGLLQFTSTGKFVRRIMNRGKGPDEFIGLHPAICYDNELFFCDAGKSRSRIFRIKLVNGQITSIPLALEGNVHDLCILSDTTMLMVSDIFDRDKAKSQIFLQDFSGKLLYRQDLAPTDLRNRRNPFQLQNEGKTKAWLSFPSCDSIATFTSGSFSTVCYCSNLEKFVPGKSYDNFVNVTFLNHTGQNLFFEMQSWSYNSKRARCNKRRLVQASLQNFSLKIVEKFRINELELDIFPDQINWQNKTTCVVSYQALEFKEKILDAKHNGMLKNGRSDSIKNLANTISNNDNPVLIIWNL
jgi:hypothetical protein